MKAKILSDNDSLLTMFRLGGIDTAKLNQFNFKDEFDKSVDSDDLAVLIIEKNSYMKEKSLVDNYRLKNSRPLIVIIGG